MTTLYIVQAEESGIPGTPEVYTDKDEADKAYVEAWREAWESTFRDDPAGLDALMAGDFDEDWPEDGGVRMWVVEADIENLQAQ